MMTYPSNLPETPVQLLTLMANTSTQIDVFSDGIIEAVKGGEINPLAVLVQLRAMQQASERILKEIDQNIMSEAGKYPGSTFEYMGNKITKAEHGTKYDYSVCNDPVLNDLIKEHESIAAKVKARQERLKAQTTPESILDPESGEVVVISPPIKKSKSGLNVQIR
jgi:DNA primase large subunit